MMFKEKNTAVRGEKKGEKNNENILLFVPERSHGDDWLPNIGRVNLIFLWEK